MSQVETLSKSIEIIERDKSFPGKILLIKKRCLAIELSSDIMDPIYLTTGTNLGYRLAVDNNTYTFVSTVIGFRINEAQTIVVLSPPRTVNHNEKRKYVRMDISTKADYCLLPYRRDKLSLFEVPYSFYQELNESTTIDISEGGAKIKTREEFMKGQYGLLTLHIPDKTVILGRTIRCEHNTGGGYHTAFEYQDITDSIRKKISDFIMEKSMESEG